MPFKLALVLAIGIAMPFVLYQAWAFVAPGLYKHEKKLAVPLLISSILLFYLGAAFAYYVVFPVMLSFFVATTPSGVQMMTDMGSYLDFVMILLLAFGLAFEVPVATVLLVWTGFVKLATLKKNRGFVLLGIFIFAAFVTPPDAVSQSAMAVPMYLLYEIGIIMAGLLLKDKIAARAKQEAEEAEREAGVVGERRRRPTRQANRGVVRLVCRSCDPLHHHARFPLFGEAHFVPRHHLPGMGVEFFVLEDRRQQSADRTVLRDSLPHRGNAARADRALLGRPSLSEPPDRVAPRDHRRVFHGVRQQRAQHLGDSLYSDQSIGPAQRHGGILDRRARAYSGGAAIR